MAKIVKYARWGADDLHARGRTAGLWEMAARPSWRFIRDYIVYSGWRDGVVGLSYAMRQVAQLLLMCDRHDIGISIDSDDTSENPAPSVTKARLFIYDNYPGGIGFSAPLFRMHHELLEATQKLIAECECENGCPGCVGPIGNTGPLVKAAALRILDLLLAPALEAAKSA